MSQNSIFNASFFELLNKMDEDLSHQVLEKGCPSCGRQLHHKVAASLRIKKHQARTIILGILGSKL